MRGKKRERAEGTITFGYPRPCPTWLKEVPHHVCVHLEARSHQWESVTNIALDLISVDKASLCTGAYHSRQNVYLMSPLSMRFHLASTGAIAVCMPPCLAFCAWAGDPSIGTYACGVSTLKTDPSPDPGSVAFWSGTQNTKQKVLIHVSSVSSRSNSLCAIKVFPKCSEPQRIIYGSKLQVKLFQTCFQVFEIM